MEFDNIVVCYGGKWQTNDDGSCEYVPTSCKRGGVNVDSNVDHSKLLGLLESRFKVTNISRLSYKFSSHLYPVDIEDDYDVSLFLKRAEKVSNAEIVFLYVVGEHGDYMSDAIVELNVPQKPCIPDLNISTYEYGDVGGSGCLDTEECFDLNDDPSLLLEDSSYKSKKRKGRILVCSPSHHFLRKVFINKEELQLELSIMALTEGFEFITLKSNKQRLEVRCRLEGCEWFLRSRSIKDTEAFHVTSFNDVHTCSKTQMHPNHRNANKKVVAHCIKGLVEDNTRNLKGKDVVNILGQRFNASLSYKQGWKGKVYAESLLVGSSEDSFGKLPIYCHNLEIANPGTRTHILRDDLNRFEMLFIAIGASVRSFIRCLRPVIIIDGAHLKGSFKGTMFLAVGMDGNNQIFPIAYGVGKSESGESWTWFLTKLKECVGDHPNLAIISDRAKSIEVAIKNVFPVAYHGFCCRHLMVNLRLKGKSERNIYWAASKAYRRSDFKRHFNLLCSKRPSARATLTAVGFGKWSRAYCPVRRYNIMTSNSAESINALSVAERKYPITKLTDYFVELQRRWFFERRQEAAKGSHLLSKWAESRTSRKLIKCRNWRVRGIDEYHYNVHDGDRRCEVDLLNRKCDCRKWQVSGLPCGHVIAVCKFKKQKDCSYLAMDYYRKEYLLSTYLEPINSVTNESEWVVPEDHVPLHPPHMDKRQAGRPRENKRIPSRGEVTAPSFCTRFHATGHKSGKCKQPLQSQLQLPRPQKRQKTEHVVKDYAGGTTEATDRVLTFDLNEF